ncbi:MAG: class I SAM-dependent methyltransferase [Pseudomonadota bacterium]|nr:class I SAM-dependent methyltransferase [Pseudomonadota bacterium]
MSDPRERFSALVTDYAAARPSYPDALFDWILGRARGTRVADLGCGTGIATRQLAARGVDVVGIDPNHAMLAEARRTGGRYLEGEATATGLAAASVDLVTVAQAMHWFDLDPSLAEIRRVLAPRGVAVAFWNLRSGGPFMDSYDALLRTHVARYVRRPGAPTRLTAVRRHPRVTKVEERTFRNDQVLDRAGLLARTRSASYVAKGVRDPAALERALVTLFERHAVGGTVTMRYDVHAIAWQPA